MAEIPGRIRIPQELPQIKLDKADMKLITELVKDARIPATALSKKIGLSKETTIYRIKRLESLGVIAEYRTKVDVTALGYNYNLVFFETKLTTEQKAEVYGYLMKHPWVNWVSPATGKWDLLLHIISRDLSHLDEILDEIYKKIKPINYTIFVVVEYLRESPDFFRLAKEQASIPKRREKYNLDKYDVEILNTLIKNGRMPFLKVSEKIGLSRDSVKTRVQQLMKSGIIEKFNTSINTPLLGYQWYAVIVKMIDPDKENEFINYILHNKSINAFFKTIGEYDFFLEIHTKSSIEFSDFVTEMLNRFGSAIVKHEEMLQFGQEFFTWFPEGLYKDLLEKVQ